MSNKNQSICQTPEEFKAIPGFENYGVSNHGRIMRIKAGVNSEAGTFKNIQYNKKTGYGHVKVTGSLGKRSMSIHRLVAEAFLENPNNYREIDHIDRDKTNNCVDNLRWCTRWENMRNLDPKKSMKPILAFPPDGSEPMIFQCIRYAAKEISKLTGLCYSPQGICNVLSKPKYTHYKGWKFKYFDSPEENHT